MSRALIATDRLTGKRRVVGRCTCGQGDTLVCGLCVQLTIEPPETRDERSDRLRQERMQAKVDRRETWTKRRRARYAALVEGR